MSADRPGPTPEADVIDLLLDQHSEIRDLFAEVTAAPAGDRVDAFQRLVRLLAVHETAEEEVVHPLARGAVPSGDSVVDDRLREEHDAKEMLSRLDEMDPGDPKFPPLLAQLRDAVLTHAEHEERHEFPWLREKCTSDELRGAATAVRAAEAVAPTRPHPGVESAKANILAGPLAAVFDRARDAVRNARSPH